MKLKDFIKMVDDRCYLRFVANDCSLSGCYKHNLQDEFKKHEIVNRQVEKIDTEITISIFNNNLAYGELVIYLEDKQ